MAKELDKFKKDWTALKKEIGALKSDYGAFATNRSHHQNIIGEGVKQIGRDVQKAKDKGATGTALKDFLQDKEVLSSVKTVMNAHAALAKEGMRLKSILGKTTKLGAAMTKLVATIDKEVAKREKKENRKLFAKESKSLPEMKKLSGDIATERIDLKSDIIDQETLNDWSAARVRKDLDRDIAAEIARTKSDRKQDDNRETDSQAMNMRLFPKTVARVQALNKAGMSQLKAAATAIKQGDRQAASEGIGKAQEALKEIKKLRVPIVRKMKDFNKYDLMRMKDEKDGKIILAGNEAMAKAETDLAATIKKLARVTT